MSFSPYKILLKKRQAKTLLAEEIEWFIEGFTSGEIPDYQMSALLMAVCIHGMSKEETAALTKAMLYSGKTLDFKDQEFVDKHSTGGVGDKASFILAPLAAACGVKVPMIAGRGLGHTGGTIDKVESVKGFKTQLPLKEFEVLVREKGFSLIGQTEEIAPADRKIYALRDVTATIESIPLITGSIMSKKLAEGAKGIVMDIKIGNGAFMKNQTEAKDLAKSLMETANSFEKNIFCFITDMNQPLGNAIGNSLEIIESIEVLKGNGPQDLEDLSVELAGAMIFIAGKAADHEEGNKKAKEALVSGRGLEVFKKMLENQGGDPRVINNYELLPAASFKTDVQAAQTGYVVGIDTKEIGLHNVSLGGGRMKASDKIDFGVGITLHKKIGDRVKKGEALLTIHHNKDQKDLTKTISEKIANVDYSYSETKPERSPLIYDRSVLWSK